VGWPNPQQVVFSANGHYVHLIHPLPLPMEPPGSIYDFEANKSVKLMDLPLLLAGQWDMGSLFVQILAEYLHLWQRSASYSPAHAVHAEMSLY
jgi:hypothetical protein